MALEFATGRLDGPSMGFDDFSLSLLMVCDPFIYKPTTDPWYRTSNYPPIPQVSCVKHSYKAADLIHVSPSSSGTLQRSIRMSS